MIDELNLLKPSTTKILFNEEISNERLVNIERGEIGRYVPGITRFASGTLRIINENDSNEIMFMRPSVFLTIIKQMGYLVFSTNQAIISMDCEDKEVDKLNEMIKNISYEDIFIQNSYDNYIPEHMTTIVIDCNLYAQIMLEDVLRKCK